MPYYHGYSTFPGILILVLMIVIIIIITCCLVICLGRNVGGSQFQRHSQLKPRDPWIPVVERRSTSRVWEPSHHLVDVVICSCGKWNGPEQTMCWNCNAHLSAISRETFTFETVEKCAVCSFWLYEGEEILLCPSCHAQGHRTHLLEFLKTKGFCPMCNQKMFAHQLLKTIPKV